MVALLSRILKCAVCKCAISQHELDTRVYYVSLLRVFTGAGSDCMPANRSDSAVCDDCVCVLLNKRLPPASVSS